MNIQDAKSLLQSREFKVDSDQDDVVHSVQLPPGHGEPEDDHFGTVTGEGLKYLADLLLTKEHYDSQQKILRNFGNVVRCAESLG